MPYLQPLPFRRPISSSARCWTAPARELKDSLAAQGVLVRYYDTPLLRDYIRISRGPPRRHRRGVIAALTRRATPGPPRHQPTRRAQVSRATAETSISVSLNLDGTGKHQIDTGMRFLDHMLAQMAVHGLFDLDVTAQGDLHIDPHHTVEDVALTLGAAFAAGAGRPSRDRAHGLLRCAHG